MFKAVGMFSDLEPKAGPHLPGLADAMNGLDAADVPRVIAHLRAGVGVIDFMEMCVDPLDAAQAHPGGSSLMSDGRWVWRADLAYYVHRYRVALDPEFVRDVRSGRLIDFRGPSRQATSAYGRAVRGEPG
jgi:hypothetical protein